MLLLKEESNPDLYRSWLKLEDFMAHQWSVISFNLVKLLAVVFRDLCHRMFGLTPDWDSFLLEILPFSRNT